MPSRQRAGELSGLRLKRFEKPKLKSVGGAGSEVVCVVGGLVGGCNNGGHWLRQWSRCSPVLPIGQEEHPPGLTRQSCLLECQQMPPLCADHCGSDCQTNVQHSWQNSPQPSDQPWQKSHSFGRCFVCNSFPLDSKQLVFLLLQVLTIVPINCITMIIDNDANHPHRYHLH